MQSSDSDATNPVLLDRIGSHPDDQIAWETFVGRYKPRIYGWCRQRGLQEADSADVTQNVLMRISQALKTFRYDPTRSFSGWLRRVTEHALSDFFEDRKRRSRADGGRDAIVKAMETVEARDELLAWFEKQFAYELVERACGIVRARVGTQTWEAYLLTAYEGRTGEEVAEKLGMTVAAVFKAKSRVLAFIRKEVERLDGPP